MSGSREECHDLCRYMCFMHLSISFVWKEEKDSYGECQHSNHLRLLFYPLRSGMHVQHCVRWLSKARKAHTGQKINCQYVKLKLILMWTKNEREKNPPFLYMEISVMDISWQRQVSGRSVPSTGKWLILQVTAISVCHGLSGAHRPLCTGKQCLT